jgi:hypothetical protein
MVTMAIIGLVITLFNYDGVSSQRAAQSSQRIAHALEGILQTERLTTTLGKTQGNVIISISTGAVKRTEGGVTKEMIKSPFFDNDPRYQIIDMVASGTSYSGTSFDIIYSQGGAISFSWAAGTGVTITTGYQGAKSYKVNLDRRSGVVTVDR